MLDAILNFLGTALAYALAGTLIVSIIILVCGAIYMKDKEEKKY